MCDTPAGARDVGGDTSAVSGGGGRDVAGAWAMSRDGRMMVWDGVGRGECVTMCNSVLTRVGGKSRVCIVDVRNDSYLSTTKETI